MSALRFCIIPVALGDIGMQGGVTSGVVYPGLVYKPAEHCDSQNIVGTSAGAIAASLTVAAKYARRKGKQDAFVCAAEVSGWLGGLRVNPC